MEKKITFNCSGRTVVIGTSNVEILDQLTRDERFEFFGRMDEYYSKEEQDKFHSFMERELSERGKEVFRNATWSSPYSQQTQPEVDWNNPWSSNYHAERRPRLKMERELSERVKEVFRNAMWSAPYSQQTQPKVDWHNPWTSDYQPEPRPRLTF